jgi:pyruvate formate-lyase/glycerol dehydratase family glycyl radical enzyme
MNTLKLFLQNLDSTGSIKRIESLKDKMLAKERFLSVEQAKIITKSYKLNKNEPTAIKRAHALHDVLCNIAIEIDPEERIVGNRAIGSKTGIVFPESGLSWIINEIDTLPTRQQDRFQVHEEEKIEFLDNIAPYWKGKTLENRTYKNLGKDLNDLAKVIKINQKDHAQGHICPNVEKWLKYGPAGLKKVVEAKLVSTAKDNERISLESMRIALKGACKFIKRYSELAIKLSIKETNEDYRSNLNKIAEVCSNLSEKPAETYHEAVQSMWFLFVLLQAESNASSFSPGRLDQILYPYYKKEIENKKINTIEALELIEAVWIKFNEIVYMRNSHSAQYFAGFPIGFNVIVGGQDINGQDATNELSYIILKAQENLQLPQPNLSVRLHKNSPDIFIRRTTDVLKLGTGMPQYFYDDSIIPALQKIGINNNDAMNYAITGCVEITTPGNNLGWSDSAMVNLIKILELTLNNGRCLQTGSKLGLDLGNITDFENYEDIEKAFEKQIRYFIDKLVTACEIVEEAHIALLPSPMLSSVIDNCIETGRDVTNGGAKYNFSGVQVIQAANLADCFAALKKLVFENNIVSKEDLFNNLKQNYPDESIRLTMLNKAPKYGNDVKWVDSIANKWVEFFSKELRKYKNYRGGDYHTGLYTVSAHVPMGKNVGATPDGRKAGEPLADGGMSAVYGRDINGPTSLLNSVNRINSEYGTNGTLLNMKFVPQVFETEEGTEKFCMLLKALTEMKINHVQFNIINKSELIKAKNNPEKYKNLLVRVAGYTAYFVELAADLQDEIIARTEFGK